MVATMTATSVTFVTTLLIALSPKLLRPLHAASDKQDGETAPLTQAIFVDFYF
jgi:hypothetical protein